MAVLSAIGLVDNTVLRVISLAKLSRYDAHRCGAITIGPAEIETSSSDEGLPDAFP
ncbi:MAG: hypothetical protein JWQ87_762 [Candidatus Sulfotelmatobacter sp.]|nr:hypothetical protein [Candidatus Sulfotelmatobacter sp.]